MVYKDVYTQTELEKAIEESFIPICREDGKFITYGATQVKAYDNVQVTAYGSTWVTPTAHSKTFA